MVGFPSAVWAELIVRLETPANESFVLRLQNVVSGGPVVTVPSLPAALGLVLNTCVETTVTMQQTRDANNAVRFKWKTAEGERSGRASLSSGKESLSSGRTSLSSGKESLSQGSASTSFGCEDAVVLDSLDIRTFTFGIRKA